MSKAYYRVGEFQQEVLDGREKVFERGYEIGFQSGYWNVNLKKGYTSYIYAHPFSGKTSLWFDIYMHIARTQLQSNEMIFVYSPEAGDKVALTAYLVQVFLGKKLHGRNAQKATEQEWLEALAFIDKKFILVDPKLVGKDKVNFSAKEFFNQAYLAEKEYNCKITLALIDPYNLLSRSEEDKFKPVPEYTLDNLYYINEVAKVLDMHVQIATHLRDEDTVIDKETGVEYMGKPFPNKIAQGQSWWRTGKIMVAMWRCPAGVVEKGTGVPYPENAVDIMVQKNKVFGAGEVGNFRLYYDDDRQKFYEIIAARRYYCGEYQERNNPTLIKHTVVEEDLDLF